MMKFGPFLSFPGLSVAAVLMLAAVPAFAECDAGQEKLVGRAVAEAVRADAESTAGPLHKAVVDLDRCEGGSVHFDTHFKVRALTEDGQPVWIEGHARGVDATVEAIQYRRASKELAALTERTALASR